MPKKSRSRRSVSRKMKRTHKRKTHHRRRTHRRGGADMLRGAPVNYHLSGDWSSRMSLGQGADYFKYHEGQHGGALAMGKYPEVVMDSGLPSALRGPAHIGGIDKAINDVKGLCDPPNCPGTTMGGKRRKHRKGSKSHKRKHHSRKHRRTHHKRRRGGALGYSPFPSQGMLLSSQKAYAEAGLNPEWKTDVAFTDAKIRDTQ
jgi:hypothetical protein